MLAHQMAAGLDAFKRLLATSDVMVTNVRQKGLAALGLDFETLHPQVCWAHRPLPLLLLCS